MLARPAVVGRYALLAKIASGGMGTVYRARLSGEGGFVRDFALKRLHPHIAGEADAVAMLLDEARLAATVHHPNVVATLDVGEDQDGFYVVMELVEGASLSELIGAAGPLASRVAVRLVLDVLEGLAAAHAAKDEHGALLEVVHRDVSPANVLVGRDGIAKLTDFGVAKARERLRTTVGVEVKGKLGYMPPEQLEGKTVDARADLFATGVVLWELLRGERLLSLGNRGRLRELEDGGEPSWLATGAGGAIDEVIRRSMRSDPEARFASARAMADALREAATSGMGVAEPSEVASLMAAHDDLLKRQRTPLESAPALPARAAATGVVVLDAAWAAPRDGADLPSGAVTLTAIAPPDARRSRRATLFATAALVVMGCGLAAFATRQGNGVALGARAGAEEASFVALPMPSSSEAGSAEPEPLPVRAATVASSVAASPTAPERAPPPKGRAPAAVRKSRGRSAAEPGPGPAESGGRVLGDPFGGRH